MRSRSTPHASAFSGAAVTAAKCLSAEQPALVSQARAKSAFFIVS